MASSIKDELKKLQEAGLAKQHKQKYKLEGTDEGAFMTPEQAEAFLAEQKNASKKGTIHQPPSGLTSGEMDSWFMQQKQREKDSRRKREEAEALLRGYRGSWSGGGSGIGSGSVGGLSSSPGPDASDARSMFQTLDQQGSKKKPEIDEETKKELATWRFIDSDPESKYKPEAGRYHMYCSLACPWSHRVLCIRALKGLQDAVSVTIVYPIWQKTRPDNPDDTHAGWIFANPESDKKLTNTEGLGGPFPASYDRNEPDPILGAYSMRDIYEQAGDSDGKFTVPILWDKQTGSIVSKESWQIMRMLNACFNEFATNPDLDLYPRDERIHIDEVADWMYPQLSNGVYMAGFAMTQDVYDKSIDALVEAFDRIEGILKTQRYICGSKLTEADIRLFVTLVRFDEIYATYFKCNVRSISASQILLNYCRDIYQMVDIKDTIDMKQCMAHYYCSHTELNKYGIIPRGVGFMKLLEESHCRDSLSS